MAAPSGSPKGGVKELGCSAGAVFMAAVFCFFMWELCAGLHCYFCGLFFYFIFLDFFSLLIYQLKKSFVFVFLYFVVNEKSTADSLLQLLPCDPSCAFGLLGEGGNGRPDLKCSEAERRGVSHEARNSTWLLFWVVAHPPAGG